MESPLFIYRLLPLTVLLKFRTDKGRNPQSVSFAEDSRLLLQIRDDVLETMGVSLELLPNTFVRYFETEAYLFSSTFFTLLSKYQTKSSTLIIRWFD